MSFAGQGYYVSFRPVPGRSPAKLEGRIGRYVSSNLAQKSYIYSIAKRVSQKLDFLSRARGVFSSAYLLTMYQSQIRPP